MTRTREMSLRLRRAVLLAVFSAVWAGASTAVDSFEHHHNAAFALLLGFAIACLAVLSVCLYLAVTE